MNNFTKVHLIIFTMRKPILHFIKFNELFFGRGEWETCLSLEQGSSLLVGFNLFILLMLGNQLP